MIGILLNLLSLVGGSASAGPQYCGSNSDYYADSADELCPDAAAGSYSESDSTGDLYMLIARASIVVRNRAHNYQISYLRIPARMATVTLSGALRLMWYHDVV
jgi:hypothetical protein